MRRNIFIDPSYARGYNARPAKLAQPVKRVSGQAKHHEPSGLSIGVRIAIWQLATGVIGAAVWGVLDGPRSAAAGFAGGLIAAIGTVYVALRAFAPSDGAPDRMLGNFVRAQVRKWAILMALFFVAITLFRDNFAPVISVFSASLLVWFLALGWTSTIPPAADE